MAAEASHAIPSRPTLCQAGAARFRRPPLRTLLQFSAEPFALLGNVQHCSAAGHFGAGQALRDDPYRGTSEGRYPVLASLTGAERLPDRQNLDRGAPAEPQNLAREPAPCVGMAQRLLWQILDHEFHLLPNPHEMAGADSPRCAGFLVAALGAAASEAAVAPESRQLRGPRINPITS